MSPTPEERPSGPLIRQVESSPSVHIFWLDRAEAVSRLREAAEALAQRYPEIERVVLFGSLARGDAVPDSDADLLLILSASDLPFLDRSVRYRPEGVGLGVDVLAYTRAEMERMLAEGNRFVADVLREGIVLFDARTA
ncbi:MAG: nucleotidyltransferase domain-containing protein [Chloroflexi bacterium]|nr:nucleotidyltransferase domain-containing protein [Chloroflexota bacterium]